jgi:UMF1 family MFS transporter
MPYMMGCMNKKTLFAWAAFDWANSAINTIVFTFIFSIYFARSVYGDEVQGSAAWAFAQGCAGVAIAILAPIVGSAVDYYGPRKRSLLFFSAICILASGFLFFVQPDPSFIMPALIIGAAMTISFELVQNIYGSTLPLIAPPDKIGFISGIGWGAGYIGSILSLGIALFAFIGLGDAGGLLGIPKDNALHVRATMLLAAGWFALFAIPFFLWCPDAKPTGNSLGQSVHMGLRELKNTIRHAWRLPQLVKFLVAAAIYRDGLVTLFSIGGLYAAGTLGMSASEVIIFAIAINLAAGLGAWMFAFFDDHIGSKTTIMVSLVALVILGAAVIATDDKFVFIALACALGLFIGPVQAASRALLVRLSPPEHIGAFFGLYALTGKSVAFMGPFAFAALTHAFSSQRIGMISILGFWAVGLVVMYFVETRKVDIRV